MMYEKTNYNLFPSLVTEYKKVLTNQQIRDLKDFLLNYETADHGAFVGEASSTHNAHFDILKTIEENVISCKGLTKKLLLLIDSYAADYGLAKNVIGNSWFNVQQKESILKQHTHSNSIISCALYVHTDKDSSNLCFDNPNPFVKYFSELTHLTEYNFEYYYFDAEPGDFILFPSWLSHGSGYKKNYTQDRIVISINTRYDEG